MEVVLVVLLLCCAAPGVRADLPVVDSAAPPEARSAVALLTPFMAPQQATLIVMGTTRWTGAFLRELSADIPRVLAPSRPNWSSTALGRHYFSDTRVGRLQQALMATRSALLVATDDEQELFLAMEAYTPLRRNIDVRVLFWSTVSTSTSVHEVLRRMSVMKMWLAGRQHALALTAPNGSTTLYRMTCTSEHSCISLHTTILETDKWSTVEQRWRLGAAVFHDFCRGYRRIGKHQDLTMFVQTLKGSDNRSSLEELTKSVVNLASRGRRPVKYKKTSGHHELDTALEECTLAAVITDGVFLDLDRLTEISFLPDLELAEFAVIVPAGYGASVSVLDAVTVEFSPALWLATGLAILSTVVVFACAPRQDVSGAVLQALAPMLGQAPPPPAPPRPTLAAWLLACVVLTAAYQGLLLRKLSSAVPQRDLESLQDLEDSGLPLKAVGNLARTNVLTDNLNARVQHVFFSETKTVIDTIATTRNCALLVFHNRHTRSFMRPHMMPRRLHVIRLSYFHFNIIAVTTKGSPLERPLARAQVRAEAAGLLARWRRAEYEREYQDDVKRLASLRGPRPLTLWHLLPAFVVLGVGQVAGVVVCTLEVLWAWRARRA
ncbi:Ionotropic receptor 181 [Frankliniella occidentalis]|nr:Ionotropic receptor 181 [Frankliniella occidentalis]